MEKQGRESNINYVFPNWQWDYKPLGPGPLKKGGDPMFTLCLQDPNPNPTLSFLQVSSTQLIVPTSDCIVKFQLVKLHKGAPSAYLK